MQTGRRYTDDERTLIGVWCDMGIPIEEQAQRLDRTPKALRSQHKRMRLTVQKHVLHTEDVCAMLHVSRCTVWRLVRKGRLRAHAVAKHARYTFCREDIDAYLQAERKRERKMLITLNLDEDEARWIVDACWREYRTELQINASARQEQPDAQERQRRLGAFAVKIDDAVNRARMLSRRHADGGK